MAKKSFALVLAFALMAAYGVGYVAADDRPMLKQAQELIAKAESTDDPQETRALLVEAKKLLDEATASPDQSSDTVSTAKSAQDLSEERERSGQGE